MESDLLTDREVVTLLRLDSLGHRNPLRTLEHYRNTGRLRYLLMGKRAVYRRQDVLQFIDAQVRGEAPAALKPPTAAFGKRRKERTDHV